MIWSFFLGWYQTEINIAHSIFFLTVSFAFCETERIMTFQLHDISSEKKKPIQWIESELRVLWTLSISAVLVVIFPTWITTDRTLILTQCITQSEQSRRYFSALYCWRKFSCQLEQNCIFNCFNQMPRTIKLTSKQTLSNLKNGFYSVASLSARLVSFSMPLQHQAS